MFDVSFAELILIAIVGLLVIGPERLPEALRTLGLWIGRMRRSFTNVKTEIEKEIGMDEIRRQLHNEAVMEEMKRIERDVRSSVHAGESGGSSKPAVKAADRAPRPEPAPGTRSVPAPREAAGAADSASAAGAGDAPADAAAAHPRPEEPAPPGTASTGEPPAPEAPPGTEPRERSNESGRVR